MRLFINNHYFISVIQKENVFNCQVMQLMHGMGMYPATIQENQKDVVSGIVNHLFNQTVLITSQLSDVFEFHKHCILQLMIEGEFYEYSIEEYNDSDVSHE